MTSGRTWERVVNGVDYRGIEWGPRGDDGPLALCLHGFPGTAHTWRLVGPSLAAHGFRVVAPFLRGFAPTGAPAGARYHYGALVADAAALHEAFGGDANAIVMGHDWGALASYGARSHCPDRFRCAIGLSIPPPGTRSMRALEYDALKAAFYLYVLASPFGEAALLSRRTRLVEGLWHDWAVDGAGIREDADRARAAVAGAPNAAAIARFHRVAMGVEAPDGFEAELAATDVLTPPVLWIHGARDARLPWATVEPQSARIAEPNGFALVADAGHLLPLERPDAVTEIVTTWSGVRTVTDVVRGCARPGVGMAARGGDEALPRPEVSRDANRAS